MRIRGPFVASPLTRAEGHGEVRISVRDGALRHASWAVVETPRFFEALLVGKRWENVPWIAGRICGICSVAHTLAAVRAVEAAFGLDPGPRAALLRLFLMHMETIQSHVLHLFFLAAPDFLGTGSVLPLVARRDAAASRAASLKRLANDGVDLVGGRRIHPTRTVVGGFTMVPTGEELEAFRGRLLAAEGELRAVAELLRTFSIPSFERETEYVSLGAAGGYPVLGGDLVSSDGVRRPEEGYREMTNEYAKEGSTAKWCRLSRPSFAVGPLARFNNNHRWLHPAAREAARFLGLSAPCHNPFMAHAARLVECFHALREGADAAGAAAAMEGCPARVPVEPRAGRGVGAVEAPRGILYHCYELDGEGRVARADCVIPTGQNHGNIQLDLERYVAHLAAEGVDDGEIVRRAEMLVRAYDPCISCSVH